MEGTSSGDEDCVDELNKPSANEKGNINDIVSLLDAGYTSENEPDMRKLVNQMNKKKKKSGGFQSMGLSYSVYKGVMRKGYKVPTPIQRKCIPLIMDGKDVVAMARTGSGKTAAFLLPMFEKLQVSSNVGIRAILLSPTRELAVQTFKFVKELGRFLSLRTALILGGDVMDQQFSDLHENPDIVIATPGRLMHVLVEMEMRLSCVQLVIFDEADRLFELGFQEHLNEILRRLPDDRQTLLFSATLPKQLVEFAKAGLSDPTLVRLDVDSKLSDQLMLSFLHVRVEDKLPALMHLLGRFEENEQSVIFVATKHHVEYLREVLNKCNIDSSYVYSSLDQDARKINVNKFRNRHTKLLIVTDVAARGLDIPMLDNVINFSFPSKPKLFVHRVGRVARAGRTGTAYSLVSPDEMPFVIDLHLFLGRSLNFAKKNHKYQDWDAVVGKVAQIVIDTELDTLKTVCNDDELKALEKIADNGYRQYLRSRPSASSESIRRSKEIAKTVDIGIHPLYENSLDSSEKLRMELLASVKGYKANTTIFEIGTTKKDRSAVVMKHSRKKNQAFMTKYKDKLNQIKNSTMDNRHEVCEDGTVPNISADAVEVQETFGSKVIRPTFNPQIAERKKKKGRRVFKDEEHYIGYKPKDFHSETGLGITSNQNNFSKEAATVTFDMMGDDDKEMRQKLSQRKVWDRKRMRYVNAQDTGVQPAKKKIKTESGAVISASYKKNLYAEWKKKTKQDEQAEENEDQGDGGGRKRGDFRGGGKHFRHMGNKKVKSELKKPEDILKARKLQAKKKKQQQKGRGRKRR